MSDIASPRSAKPIGPLESFTPPRGPFGVTCIVPLFALTGASGLMLEVVWSRMLGWLLGATTWAVMAVLVAYMGGLGLGAILWGRVAGLSARPLRLFGLMELAIGLYSLAVPLLFDRLGILFVAAEHAIGESPALSIALRALTAVLALAPPTLLMGGTLPVLTRFAAAGRAQPGQVAGLLYAVNTAGAVLGCVLTGCFLISWLGVIETNLAAAAIDIGVGLVAIGWGRHAPPSPIESGPAVSAPSQPRGTRGALPIAVASGFCGLAYEVLWTRGLLAAMTDDTTYAFALMLTAFLAGHAMGAAAAARAGLDASVDRSWRALGTAQILAALFALVSLPFLVVIRDPINRVSFIEGMSFWGARIPFHLVISLAVFAPSAFCLGASFALTARLYVGRGRPVGVSTGRLYGLNTLGSILGAIVTTAWLIPTLGTRNAMIALTLAQASLGGAALVFGGSAGRRHERVLAAFGWAAAVAVGCGLNVFFPLSRVYEHHEPGKLLALVDGAGAAITVHQRTPSDRVISINGVNVAGTNPVLRATQKLQAHLPLFLHRAPRSVLQVGFGSGGTCYSVSLHGEVESIDVVELNPDIPRVATEWFGDVNHHVLSDPRVRLRIVDAKSHVASTGLSYDLILSDSTHPRFRGNAALYARDYFANCARRLRPGGIVSTWLPLYGMSVDDIRGILKSFLDVFPHVQVWYANPEPHENTLIIASREPIVIDPASLARGLAAPSVAADLGEVGISSATQILDYFLLGDRAVAEFSKTGRLNTDDHPRLEFLAPMSLRRRQSWVDNFAALRLAREPIDTYLAPGTNPAERARLARWTEGTSHKLAGQSLELEGKIPEAIEAYAEGVRLNPEDLLAQIRLNRMRRAADPRSPLVSPPGGVR